MKNLKNSGIEWLGEIPEHWEVVKIKHIFNIGRGRVISQEELDENGNFPVYSSQTTNNGILGYIKTYDFDCEQITWTTDGVNAGTIFLRNGKYNCTNVCGILKPRNNENMSFLTYALQNVTPYYKRPDTNGAKIMNNEMANIQIVYPPLKEQEQIANFLDEKCEKIQNFIEKKEKLLSLLQEQKQALINETITKGLDKNVKLKNSGIEWLGEIPEHWEVRKLKMLFSFGNGLNITKADFISFGIPCISYGEIHSKYPCRLDLSVHKLPFVSETYLNDKPQSLLSKGDFVFADTSEDIEGSGNFTCIQSNIPLFAGYHTIILRPKTQIYSLYFSFLFDSIFVRNQIREKVWGVKVFSITKSILKEVQCFIPPLKEQEQIANFLDEKCEKIDSLITKIKKQIELIKEYKTTLINEAVCGRINN
ncbi:restriction endonuclease subunit S [Campylobacter sp. RM3125]|uniref:restriction endonuclease subunit S n=1 Tax=Campylobacter molothri TaxID=1032242 RepID=UPI00301C5205|nr:restriction endonuclease subunit S [Campylobacter sp. RM3125]MBZ7971667.1 restriction endonuclease subunit S [Campylobacter sp. RM3124]